MTASLLIVDDEPTIRRTLRYLFEGKRYEVHEAASGAEGLDLARSAAPDVVLLDVKLPDLDGLDVLSRLREVSPVSVVLVMTAHGDVEMAVEAIRNRGAFWFFQKPIDMGLLELQVEQAVDHARAQRRGTLAERRVAALQPFTESLGESEPMREVGRLVDMLAASRDTTVLLMGASGTGKGLVAETIHRHSARRGAPFQEINCAGLSETFLESELFGAERGAYTDAKALKRGLLEVADGGTVFLDEIGDLAPALQPKLLKVLESRRFRRLGGVKDIEVDVRIIAATNKDLQRMAEEGRFRDDLYYRLNVMAIRLPLLRERGDDILLLAQAFVEHFNRTLGRTVKGIAPDAAALLRAHPWPGNVRELRNVIERAMILCNEEIIEVQHLPRDLGRVREGLAAPVASADHVATLEEVEKAHVGETLRRLEGNRSRTAQALGISRSTLIEKIKKYELGPA